MASLSNVLDEGVAIRTRTNVFTAGWITPVSVSNTSKKLAVASGRSTVPARGIRGRADKAVRVVVPRIGHELEAGPRLPIPFQVDGAVFRARESGESTNGLTADLRNRAIWAVRFKAEP